MQSAAPNFQVPKLTKLYKEMARTKGAIGPEMRVALAAARKHGDEFSVKEFCAWLQAAGGKGIPANVNVHLKRLSAPEGTKPTAENPLIVTKPGRQGPGGDGLFRYAFNGEAGAAVKTPKMASDLENARAAAKQYDDEESGEDLSQNWLPTPDRDSDNYAESSMAKLADAGMGPDDPFWEEVKEADDDMAVHDLIKGSGTLPQYHRAMMVVSKEIFSRLNKDWDGSGPKRHMQSTSAGKVGDPKRKPSPAPFKMQQKQQADEPEPQAFNYDDFEVAGDDEPAASEPESDIRPDSNTASSAYDNLSLDDDDFGLGPAGRHTVEPPKPEPKRQEPIVARAAPPAVDKLALAKQQADQDYARKNFDRDSDKRSQEHEREKQRKLGPSWLKRR